MLSESSDANSIKNTLIIICQFLSKFPCLTSKLLKLGLLDHWAKHIRFHVSLCISIFEVLLPQVYRSRVEEWFRKYHGYLKDGKKCSIHILILTCLTKRVRLEVLLDALESGIGEQIDALSKSEDSYLKICSANLRKTFEQTLKNYSWNAWAVCGLSNYSGNLPHLC